MKQQFWLHLKCNNLKGFPSNENISRIHKSSCKVDKKSCDKECINSVKDLNQIYYIKQDENRQKEAKILKDKRRYLSKLLDDKILKEQHSIIIEYYFLIY